MECILVGNEKIAYKQIGNKKSIYTFIFIHGATMTGGAMIDLAKKFPDYNCIIVDLPGHGGSLGKTKNNIEDFAESIDLFLQEMLKQELISKHITLIGYSLGGVISFELALKKRDEYKRMIIISSGASVSKCAPLMDEIKKLPKDQFDLEGFFAHVFGSASSENEKNYVMNLLSASIVDINIGYTDLLSATNYNKIDRANEVSIPTLIFTGDEDKVILPSCGIELWRELENASIAIVPWRGHTAFLELTDYFVSLVNDFCRHNS